MSVKVFWTYYLISGVIMLYYLVAKWEDVIRIYPQLEMVHKNILLLIQFVLGFIFLPIGIVALIWLKVQRISSRRAPQIRMLTEEESRAHQAQRLAAMKELLEKHKDSIKDIVELGDKKMIPFFESYDKITMQDVKIEAIREMQFNFDGRDRIKKMVILTKGEYIIEIPEEKVHLLEGWETVCIIKNPFPETDGEKQGEEVH